MEFFDSHAHYDDEKFNDDREELIEKMYNENVKRIVSAGYSLSGSKRGIELSKKYPYIYTTVGISPNDINENYVEEINEIDKILKKYNYSNAPENEEENSNTNNGKNGDKNYHKAQNTNLNTEYTKIITPNINHKMHINSKKSINKNKPKIVAIGEIGLDYHYNTDKEKQKNAFTMQIKLANKYRMPIVIHTREAVMDTLEILKNNPVEKRGVFHCCPFNRELVKEALKLGYYIAFGGTCTFKNAKNAKEIVEMVPNDRFLIETDSPYLSPEPVRGTRNDSRNLKYIVKKIAEFKQESEEKIAKMSYNNANKIFEIK